MKTKILFAFFLLLTILLSSFTLPQKAKAQEKASGESAAFKNILAYRATDNRAEILRKYLERYNSPLAPYAQDFVTQADMYNIDWKLLVAISGVESTFGKEVPCTNAWGYGVYGTQTLCFKSYPEAIQIISRDLRNRYMNQWGATDVWAIGKLYASSPVWATHVVYFLNNIQQFAYLPENQPLPISL